MNKFEFKRYIPIEKVDDEQRMVYGLASTPDLDSDGEVIEISAMEKALPSYMQFPTIREMHQPKVAGSTKSAEITDRGLYIGAKITSDDAWKMVKSGDYRGFSIGGNVTQRVGNTIKGLDLVEISLVDVPANKQAKIELWKRDDKFEKIVEALYLTLRKEVNGMEVEKKKVENEEVKPEVVEETKEEVKPEIVDGSTEVKEEVKEEIKEEVKPEEVVETPEAPASDETKETSAKTTLEKLAGIDKELDALKTAKVEETIEKMDLTKAVDAMANTLTKVSGMLKNIEDRLVKVENTPAAIKSKAAFVEKVGNEVVKADEDAKNPQLVAKLARLEELKKLREELGANAFAKQGLSMEASRLQNEITVLGAK